MNNSEKIINYLKNNKFACKSNLSPVKIISEKNKNNENLLYVKATQLEKQYGTNYSNLVIYYGFNQNGDYVGQV